MWRSVAFAMVSVQASAQSSSSSSCLRKDDVLLQVGRTARASEVDVNQTSLVEAEEATTRSGKEKTHFDLIIQLRRRGHTCPDGSYWKPNYGELVWDCRLARAAKKWSQRQASERFEGHVVRGSEPCGRSEAEGYPKYKGCGENLALGNGDPAAAIEQLKKSNDHCRNMMDPQYNMVGVGYVYDANSNFKHYWTDVFGKHHKRPDQTCIGGSPSDHQRGCNDADLACSSYKKQNLCGSYNVKQVCRDTCDLCGGGGNRPAPAPPASAPPSSGGQCRDVPGQACQYYKTNNMCHYASMKTHCKLTCGHCR